MNARVLIYYNVKTYIKYYKFNMKVKQLFLVKFSMSIKKQTSMNIFLFGETKNLIRNLIRFYLTLINNLFYEKNKWPQSFDSGSDENSITTY